MRNRLTAITVLAAGFVFLAAAVHAMDLGGVDIHGFASQGFIKTTRENNFAVGNSGRGSFNFNDFAINFSKELTPGLRVGLQLLAMDRSTYGKDKVILDWAYGDYRVNDWLGFRAGKVKVPLGLYNESRDNDALRTFIFLPQNEYYEYERDSFNAVTGGSVYGSVPLGAAGRVNYQLQVGTFPIAVDGGSAKNYSAFISTPDVALTVTDVNSETSVVHHLEWRTPVEGLRATFSGLHTDFKGKAQGIGADGPVDASWRFKSLHRYIFGMEYTYNDLILASEYQLDDYTVSANYDPDPNDESFSSKQSADGWYLSATYRFTDWLELGGYYHETYADRHDRDGSALVTTGYVAYPWNAWQKDTALTVRLDPMPHLVLKLEGHLEEGTWLISEASGAEKRNWYIVATKATVTF